MRKFPFYMVNMLTRLRDFELYMFRWLDNVLLFEKKFLHQLMTSNDRFRKEKNFTKKDFESNILPGNLN